MATPDTHPTTGGLLRCVVVTPERAVLDAEATFVALPMYDGELGVQPGRLPLIGRLGFGELRIAGPAGTQRFFVDGGFVQIRANVVTVLTSKAVAAEKINVAAARAVLAQAHAVQPTPEAQEASLKAQERARAQLRVAGHEHPADALAGAH